MINDKNRSYVFFIGCIGFRLFISIFAKYINKDYLPIMAYIAIIIGIGFTVIYITGIRKTGYEAGGKIWWNHLRPVHAMLYFIFAYMVFEKDDNAWIALLIDALLGIISKVIHIIFIL